ncbi:MAG: SPFH domain-containing protein, partial [Prevotellaceae bacterium]|nr:SPFH domain-containing protein [Prevotellaceae bacterium]
MNTEEKVFAGVRLNGIMMLIVDLLLMAATVTLFVFGARELNEGGGSFVLTSVVLLVLNCLSWPGFMQIEPNEARVMVFFGKYRGTIKIDGFHWVNPFYAKKRLTLRARNLDAEPIKVNDKKGNPVMIGQVLVWRVV